MAVSNADGDSLTFLEFHKEVVSSLLGQKFVEGNTWYLVDVTWMKKWKKYVGYEQRDQSGTWKSENFPGPVQTSNLFTDLETEVLKEHLMEELDYSLVPEKAWNHLVRYYGLSDDSKPIARRVVKYGLYMKHCKIEVYQLNLKLSLHPKLSVMTAETFSRTDTVGDLEAVMRRLHAVPGAMPCRVWHRYMSHTYELLSDPFQTLQDAGLYNMQTIVLEVQNSDGTWPRAQIRKYGTPKMSIQGTPKKDTDSDSKQGSKAKKAEKVAKMQLATSVDWKPCNQPPDEAIAGAVTLTNDDWLSTQQKSQHDELLQSVAYEQKRANQASQRAQDALNRLAEKEGQLKSLNKILEEKTLQVEDLEKMLKDQQQKRVEEKRRAVEAEEELRSHLQQLVDSFITAEQERKAANARYKAAEEIIKPLQTELQNVQQQQQSTTQQLQASQQQLQDTEQRLQQTQERADQQQQRATITETRLRHSDQMFQDIFQRLIGQLPQSQPQWVIQRNEIQLAEEELGAGGWATVRVGTFRGNRVAAKCLHRQIVSAHNVRIFTREMNMAANARHPNLLQFIGATLDNEEPIILTELMPTSLCRVMEEGTHLTHPQITSISCQVALALNYLHLTQPEAIIHRDVSSSNVLLEPFNSGFKAKLSDYGSANFVCHTATAGPGNPTYAAPEASHPEQQSTKMDVFSFGVLLVEMCAGELAPRELRDRLLGSIQWPPIVTLIRSCLRHDPQRRPDMATIITQLDQL